jgi:hypothetical protein
MAVLHAGRPFYVVDIGVNAILYRAHRDRLVLDEGGGGGRFSWTAATAPRDPIR